MRVRESLSLTFRWEFRRTCNNTSNSDEGYLMKNGRVYALIFASVYPHYVKKAEPKDRTKEELDEGS